MVGEEKMENQVFPLSESIFQLPLDVRAKNVIAIPRNKYTLIYGLCALLKINSEKWYSQNRSSRSKNYGLGHATSPFPLLSIVLLLLDP